MFRRLLDGIRSVAEHLYTTLSAMILRDRPRRQRFWLHIRKAFAIWLDRERSNVWLHVDQPPMYDSLPIPFRGPMEFKGWALAKRGIATITIHCDEEQVAEATYGRPRIDVAALSAHFRRSIRSGFSAIVDASSLPPGLHTLTVAAHSSDGFAARHSCKIVVEHGITDYLVWRQRFGTTLAGLQWMARHVDYLPWQPCVSVVGVCSDPETCCLFEATLRSLQEQVYPNWRLELACDKGMYEQTEDLRTTLLGLDTRVSFHVPPFAGTGAPPGLPVGLSQGEVFVPVDPGDVLDPQALFEIVYTFNRHSDTGLVYSDHDHVLPDGRRCQPVFQLSTDPVHAEMGRNLGRLWALRPEKLPRNPLAQTTDGFIPEEVLQRAILDGRPLTRHIRQILCSRPVNHAQKHGIGTDVAATPRVLPQPGATVSYGAYPLVDTKRVRQILLVMLDHLGDVLLTFPAIRRLKELFPNAEITGLVGSWSAALARGCPDVDQVLTYDFYDASSALPPRRLSAEEIRELSDWLASHQFDLAIDFRREPETREFLRWSGAKITVGYARQRIAPWLTIAVPADANVARNRPRRHVSQEHLHLIEMIVTASRPEAFPTLQIADSAADTLVAELTTHARPGQLLAAIHPGSGRAIKCWPAGHFARLADRLCDELDAHVVLLGSQAEIPLVEGVLAAMRSKDRATSLAGGLTIAQLAACLGNFDLFVGNDSGPTHLAAVSRVPTLCICSGTNDPVQWAPLGPSVLVIQQRVPCSPCYLRHVEECPFHLECLSNLSVDSAWEACLRVLLPKWGKRKMPPVPPARAERLELSQHPGEWAAAP